MVSGVGSLIVAAVPIWERLDPPDRARLGLAFIAFVLLFFAVIAFVVIAGRMARREIRKPLPPVRDLTDTWADKPLKRNALPDSDDRTATSDETGSP